MALFTIEVPDELAPGVIATAVLQDKQPEEVVQEYAIALATQTCQDMKVGPYYVGPVNPQFNQDGTPYEAEVGE
jgi:hypothetical protein